MDRDNILGLELPRGAPLRFSPTDIAQYIRLDQCRRYLRLRLVERNAGTDFQRAWDSQPQSIPPLLTRSGRRFERAAEESIARVSASVTCDRSERQERGTGSNNDLLIEAAGRLGPGERVVVFQPLLQAEINGWDL